MIIDFHNNKIIILRLKNVTGENFSLNWFGLDWKNHQNKTNSSCSMVHTHVAKIQDICLFPFLFHLHSSCVLDKECVRGTCLGSRGQNKKGEKSKFFGG